MSWHDMKCGCTKMYRTTQQSMIYDGIEWIELEPKSGSTIIVDSPYVYGPKFRQNETTLSFPCEFDSSHLVCAMTESSKTIRHFSEHWIPVNLWEKFVFCSKTEKMRRGNNNVRQELKSNCLVIQHALFFIAITKSVLIFKIFHCLPL